MVAMRLLILLFAGSLMIGGCAATGTKPETPLPPPTTVSAPPPSAIPEPPLSAPNPVSAPEPTSGKVIFADEKLFDPDKTVLRPEGMAFLDELAVRIQNLNEHILVVGHADQLETKGSDTYAQGLSERRAYAVRSYLINKGVDESKVGIVGSGETRPEAGTVIREEEVIKVYFGTNRGITGNLDPYDFFSDHISQDNLRLGIANVSIPRKHEKGKVESPFSIFRVITLRPNPSKHFAFDGAIMRLTQSQFVTKIKASLAVLPGAQIVVYIHGLDNRFSEAAFRAAQITRDLRDEGIPVVSALFSWPTGAATFIPTKQQYLAAKDKTYGASMKLQEFLEVLSSAAPDSTIHLVAHSMGADVLSMALNDIGEDELAVMFRGKTRLKFNEIILAAPDIRESDFAKKILPAVKSHHRVTLYASSNDRALYESKLANEGMRAGDMGNNPVSVDGVQLIDATKVNNSFVGHTFWAESDAVIHDLALVLEGKQPLERGLLPEGTHWIFP